ncbi:MAG: ATP-binding cassette domain-containing protein [Candidatus Dormibacteraeota bacterium]|uniref:ATP-binding cassette domain-containing protein n=1 Tax=Candidatus Amunia macphersoniae TaxID=3127014 RepID=A0A934KF34_9BACT|nr:ATP-binding cassette domain-containing protein [Candidatus Dormibacteraeota bacterium]
MNPAPRLEALGLWARRGAETVLSDVSLELRRGELVLLQGPNGSGKSTLLETLAGLIRPAAGEILLDGESIAGLGADRVARRGLALVHQERHLFGTLSVRDNLALADFGRRPTAGMDSVDATLESFGLERFAATPAGLLSGGEQRLVALARGLRARPLVALLDEPLAALAGGLRDHVLKGVRGMADGGTSVLVVEHDGERVGQYADRSLMLRNSTITEAVLPGGLR